MRKAPEMKIRRRGYNEPIPAECAGNSPRGEYKWGASIRVNTPGGVGELYADVYALDTEVKVSFPDNDDFEPRTYPINQVSRISRRA
jgi:hypothetical protein